MRKVAAVGLAGVVAMLLPGAATGQSQSPGEFTLEHQGGATRNAAELLDEKLPNMGVQGLLEEANREESSFWGEGCKPRHPDLPEPARTYCFNKGDNDGTDWYPQGITSTADAHYDGAWGSKRALLTSWYDHKKEDANGDGKDDVPKGARISFYDRDSKKYQHVLLVYPFATENGPSYEAVTNPQRGQGESIHAGGIVWYGHNIYVADTYRGIRVFDVRKIMDLAQADDGDTSQHDKVGLHNGKYHGHGYRYVLPQVDTWQDPEFDPGRPDDAPGKCTAHGKWSYSNISLDRSVKPSLVVGESCSGTTGYPGRAAQLGLGPRSAPDDDDGVWSSGPAFKLPTHLVQGVTSYNGTWYVSSLYGGSNDPGQTPSRFRRGWLQTATGLSTPGGGDVLLEKTCRQTLAGVQTLSYWARRDELWSLTEHPDEATTPSKEKRVMYALPAAPTDESQSCGKPKPPPDDE